MNYIEDALRRQAAMFAALLGGGQRREEDEEKRAGSGGETEPESGVDGALRVLSHTGLSGRNGGMESAAGAARGRAASSGGGNTGTDGCGYCHSGEHGSGELLYKKRADRDGTAECGKKCNSEEKRRGHGTRAWRSGNDLPGGVLFRGRRGRGRNRWNRAGGRRGIRRGTVPDVSAGRKTV